MKSFTRNEIYDSIIEAYRVHLKSFNSSTVLKAVDEFMEEICQSAGIANNKWLKGDIPENIVKIKSENITDPFVQTRFLAELGLRHNDPNTYIIYLSDDVFSLIDRVSYGQGIDINKCINLILDFSINNYEVGLKNNPREFRFNKVEVRIDLFKKRDIEIIMDAFNNADDSLLIDRIEDMILIMIQQVVDYQWSYLTLSR